MIQTIKSACDISAAGFCWSAFILNWLPTIQAIGIIASTLWVIYRAYEAWKTKKEKKDENK